LSAAGQIAKALGNVGTPVSNDGAQSGSSVVTLELSKGFEHFTETDQEKILCGIKSFISLEDGIQLMIVSKVDKRL
jgi:hypothetical protein